jgi:RHH-type proline utilization regulon transcriptional repressor/proline dehydrogenase/delta 1-pyrroline-5-carboxylate dehydrogenase
MLETAADLLEVSGARISSRCCSARAARRSMTPSPKCARPIDFCRYYAAQGTRSCSAPASRMPGPTGESNAAAPARPRRHSSPSRRGTFPLATFLGQVTAGTDGRQRRRRQARRANAADRRGSRHGCCTKPASRHPRCSSFPGDGRTGAALVAHPDVCSGVVFTGSTEVARIDQPGARRQGRTDRAADRRNRRHQCDDRRRHRAARAGRRRRRDLRLPLRRPALLGAAAAVPAGRRRRPHDRDHRRQRRANSSSAIRARSRHPCRPGDRSPRPKRRARRAHRPHEEPKQSACASPDTAPSTGNLRRTAHHRTVRRADQLTEEVFGPLLHVVRYAADRTRTACCTQIERAAATG